MITILKYKSRQNETDVEIRNGKRRHKFSDKGNSYLKRRTQLLKQGYAEVSTGKRNVWRFQTADEKPYKPKVATRTIAGLKGTYNKKRKEWKFTYLAETTSLTLTARNIKFQGQWKVKLSDQTIAKGDTLESAIIRAKRNIERSGYVSMTANEWIDDLIEKAKYQCQNE